MRCIKLARPLAINIAIPPKASGHRRAVRHVTSEDTAEAALWQGLQEFCPKFQFVKNRKINDPCGQGEDLLRHRFLIDVKKL